MRTFVKLKSSGNDSELQTLIQIEPFYYRWDALTMKAAEYEKREGY